MGGVVRAATGLIFGKPDLPKQVEQVALAPEVEAAPKVAKEIDPGFKNLKKKGRYGTVLTAGGTLGSLDIEKNELLGS